MVVSGKATDKEVQNAKALLSRMKFHFRCDVRSLMASRHGPNVLFEQFKWMSTHTNSGRRDLDEMLFFERVVMVVYICCVV